MNDKIQCPTCNGTAIISLGDIKCEPCPDCVYGWFDDRRSRIDRRQQIRRQDDFIAELERFANDPRTESFLKEALENVERHYKKFIEAEKYK